MALGDHRRRPEGGRAYGHTRWAAANPCGNRVGRLNNRFFQLRVLLDGDAYDSKADENERHGTGGKIPALRSDARTIDHHLGNYLSPAVLATGEYLR